MLPFIKKKNNKSILKTQRDITKKPFKLTLFTPFYGIHIYNQLILMLVQL